MCVFFFFLLALLYVCVLRIKPHIGRERWNTGILYTVQFIMYTVYNYWNNMQQQQKHTNGTFYCKYGYFLFVLFIYNIWILHKIIYKYIIYNLLLYTFKTFYIYFKMQFSLNFLKQFKKKSNHCPFNMYLWTIQICWSVVQICWFLFLPFYYFISTLSKLWTQ